MQEQAIKEKINERYGKIALEGNPESCCAPTECCGSNESDLGRSNGKKHWI